MHELSLLLSIILSVTNLSLIILNIFRNHKLGIKEIVEGQRCLLRSNMLHVYYKKRELPCTIRQYELENFIMSYSAYKSLGGNHFIDKIYTEVKTWTVVS